jgi:hypothetical protein
MLTFLSKLQRKPERVRRKIALFASTALTGIIILIWLTTFSGSAPEPSKSVSDQDEAGPFQALTENLSAFFLDASETMQATISIFSGFKEKATTTGDGVISAPAAE